MPHAHIADERSVYTRRYAPQVEPEPQHTEVGANFGLVAACVIGRACANFDRQLGARLAFIWLIRNIRARRIRKSRARRICSPRPILGEPRRGQHQAGDQHIRNAKSFHVCRLRYVPSRRVEG